jgi:hypothetical protein
MEELTEEVFIAARQKRALHSPLSRFAASSMKLQVMLSTVRQGQIHTVNPWPWFGNPHR